MSKKLRAAARLRIRTSAGPGSGAGMSSVSYTHLDVYKRQAMTQNRDLKVFVANGHYDLATPFFATEYTFDHLGLCLLYTSRCV